MNEPTYLGDGVYASFDGWQIKLMTDDPSEPMDVIFLEFDTANALIKYTKQVFDASEPGSADYAINYTLYDNCSVCGLPIADDEDVHDDEDGLDCHAVCCPVCKDEDEAEGINNE